MKGEEKEMQEATKKLGQALGEAKGEEFAQIGQSIIKDQLLPKNVLGLSDNLLEGIYGQAYRMYNAGKYKDASQLFRLLILLNGTEAKYSLGYAACFHMMKDYKTAIGLYTMCGAADPKSPIPAYHASDCFLQLGDKLAAIITLELAIKRSGDKPEYRALKDRAAMTVQSLQKELGVTGSPSKKG